MPSFDPLSTLFMSTVGNAMSSPVMQNTVRGRGSLIHVLCDVTSTQRIRHPPKAFAHMLLNAGDRKLLRNRRMPRILHRQGKHSRVQSFGMDQSQLSSKEREKVK
jgi:hypothetical protein